MSKKLVVIGDKCIIRTQDTVCKTTEDLVSSDLFKDVVWRFVRHLKQKESPLVEVFVGGKVNKKEFKKLIKTFQLLSAFSKEVVLEMYPTASSFLSNPELLNDFVEGLYNYWRFFKRFLICSPVNRVGEEQRIYKPYRIFNETVETLTHLVRAVYRDIRENITGQHPQIYRQVCAGAQIALITAESTALYPKKYKILEEVPVIRQVLLNPPLILHPSMNKRSGEFRKTEKTPFPFLETNMNPEEWLCYPAKVGPVLVHLFFEQQFIDLGCSLSNLFELASEEEAARLPDAICCYGVQGAFLRKIGLGPTTFCDDKENNIMVASISGGKKFGYLGYLKKMALTLHNAVMIKCGQMPYHGAMVEIAVKAGVGKRGSNKATALLIGNTGGGKSETLEALRLLGKDFITSMTIIADDMGSIKIVDGKIVGYGTETGAFVRLDDLSLGYAFDQIDRSVIMGAGEINARAVLPITTLANVLRGYEIDFILYANNYEEVDGAHPVIEQFFDLDSALSVFREGVSASKGTTTTTGITRAYFANIFGPPSYYEEHEKLAHMHFKAALDADVFVGQIRTRLAISGYEQKGPEAAAKALIKLIKG